MYVMDANKTTSFILKPDELKLNNKYLINENVRAFLIKKNISLLIDVFDSEPQAVNKPTLLFIHGNSTSKNVFASQIAHYQNHFRILAVDLLGHGKSTKVSDLEQLTAQEKTLLAETIYNLCVMTAAIIALLNEKKISTIHVIGWSLGGHIAYGMAVESPALVASITTIGSPPISFSSAGLKKGLSTWFVDTLIPEWINDPKFYSSMDAEKIMLRMGFTAEDSMVAADLKATDPQMRKCLFKKINDYEQHYSTVLNGETFVKTTSIPLCLIYGENDTGMNIEYIKQFHQFANPHSLLVIIKNAPHAVFSTHYQELIQITDRFIAQFS